MPLPNLVINNYDAVKRSIDEMICKCKKADEASMKHGEGFSRMCIECYSEDPDQRAASIQCGHIFCRDCVEGKEACPFCQESTTFVRLFEDEKRSRDCGICFFEAPRSRKFFPACGHSCCACCATRIYFDATAAGQLTSCPFCRVQSVSIQYLNELIIRSDSVGEDAELLGVIEAVRKAN